MPRHTRVIASLVCSSLFASPLFAQTAPREDPSAGPMIGVTIGVPGYERHAETDLLILGLDVLDARPSRLGIDFSLGTIPRVLQSQTLVLGGRLDAVIPVAITPDFWVMPVAGGSMIGAAASGSGAGAVGFNAGIGAILWSGKLGLRTSMTWHRFGGAEGTIWLAEIGVVGHR